jgi:hypothetical protein
MKTRIAAGAMIDAVSPDELDARMDKFTAHWYQEKARGITIARFEAIGTVAATNVLIPPNGTPEPIGPYKGFAWFIHSIAVSGLAAGDVVQVYRNVVQPTRLRAQLTFANPAATFGSKGLILLGDERLLFANLGALTATGDITVNGEATECPETDLYKLAS